jgi:hypothetical protein
MGHVNVIVVLHTESQSLTLLPHTGPWSVAVLQMLGPDHIIVMAHMVS